MSLPQPIRQALVALYFVCCAGVLITGFTPWYIAGRVPSWPTHPDATHTLPFNNHGTIHYMLRGEGFWIDNFWLVFAPCFLYVVIIKGLAQGYSIDLSKWRRPD